MRLLNQNMKSLEVKIEYLEKQRSRTVGETSQKLSENTGERLNKYLASLEQIRSFVNYTPDRQLHADVESKHKTADIWCDKSEVKMECTSYLCESSRSCTAPSTAVRLLFSSVRALVASCCITSDRLYNSIVSPGSTCRA